jgi:CRP/FNR family cyclic AMP-dependent transcriptional regulator
MSYEKEMEEKIKMKENLPQKLDFSVLSYFWQSNPLGNSKDSETIPRFLRKIEVLKNFSDGELRILCNYLHARKFAPKEKIFSQGDLGVGFYFVFNGYADIIVESSAMEVQTEEDRRPNVILTLEKYDYFGELALLQETSKRSANAVSREGCELLGILKPDVEELIYSYPLIAAKLLQSVSLIVANRLYSITKEVKELKHKISIMECN